MRRSRMQPLGFRFDLDALLIEGTAHRTGCPLIPALPPVDAVRLAAGDVYRSQRCPRVCECSPPFETLLSYQLEPRAG
jgi:hypothetical protein